MTLYQRTYAKLNISKACLDTYTQNNGSKVSEMYVMKEQEPRIPKYGPVILWKIKLFHFKIPSWYVIAYTFSFICMVNFSAKIHAYRNYNIQNLLTRVLTFLQKIAISKVLHQKLVHAHVLDPKNIYEM